MNAMLKKGRKFFPKNISLLILILLLSFNFIVVIFFLANQYWLDRKENYQNNTLRILNVINMLKNDKLISREGKIKFINEKSTDVTITQNPLWNTQLKINELNQLEQKIKHRKTRYLRISYEIEPDVWLNISLDRMPYIFYLTMIIVFFEIFFTLLIIIYVWSIQQFANYLKRTKAVANRLGVNLPMKQHTLIAPAVVKNAELALDIFCNKIQQLLNDRTTALAAISHDIRTPLTRIKLHLQFLQDQSRSDAINDDIDEIDHLLTELLHFAKYNAVEENRTTFDLISLLESICLDMQALGYDIKFNTTLSKYICTKQKISLKRAFSNIIDNAIKYGGNCVVTIEQLAEGLVILFEDEGQGIPPQLHEKVFEPFYRCDQSRSRLLGGTGLGLTIVKAIILANQGSVELENREVKGLRVKVLF